MAEITVNDTHARLQSAQILDVRENPEVASGMLPGALHIPMSELQTRVSELDQNTPVIVICRSGNRSAHVADALATAGIPADTMTGGMTAWTRAGFPTT